MAQAWIHLARDMAPQVPELPAVIEQEVATLSNRELTEELLTQMARSITRRVEEAGHQELAASLLRRMGRAIYELLLLLATEEELRAMGMLVQAAQAAPPPVAGWTAPPPPSTPLAPEPEPQKGTTAPSFQAPPSSLPAPADLHRFEPAVKAPTKPERDGQLAGTGAIGPTARPASATSTPQPPSPAHGPLPEGKGRVGRPGEGIIPAAKGPGVGASAQRTSEADAPSLGSAAAGPTPASAKSQPATPAAQSPSLPDRSVQEEGSKGAVPSPRAVVPAGGGAAAPAIPKFRPSSAPAVPSAPTASGSNPPRVPPGAPVPNVAASPARVAPVNAMRPPAPGTGRPMAASTPTNDVPGDTRSAPLPAVAPPGKGQRPQSSTMTAGQAAKVEPPKAQAAPASEAKDEPPGAPASADPSTPAQPSLSSAPPSGPTSAGPGEARKDDPPPIPPAGTRPDPLGSTKGEGESLNISHPEPSISSRPMVHRNGSDEEEVALWGFDPAAREPAEPESPPAPLPDSVPPSPDSGPLIAVEATAVAPSAVPALVGAGTLTARPRPNHGWSVRLSPKASEERERRLQQRQAELPAVVDAIVEQVHQQRRAVSDRGLSRQAVRAAAEQTAPSDLPSASVTMGELLDAKRLADAAALALRVTEAFPGEVSADLACRAGEACRQAKDADLAALCFTTAVLAAPPCEAACWQLAGMALEQRDARLAPTWLEFLARLLRVRGADEDAIVVYRQLLNLAPRRHDVRDILRVASLTGTLPD